MSSAYIPSEADPAALAAGRWAAQRSGDGATGLLLQQVLNAAGQGMVGIDARTCPVDLAGPLACGWLTTDPQRPAPLVLDHGRITLWRHQQAEQRVAHALLQRAGTAFLADLQPPDPALLRGSSDAQALAIGQLGRTTLGVLTGGPGTGKTTTVRRILQRLQAHRLLHDAPALRIALAAPTGKAAQRLAEALRAQTSVPGSAAAHDQTDLPLPSSACTLHALLGFQPRSGTWQHGVDDPLMLDVLVIDEASMVDLEVMDAVLAALPTDALLLLVGDADQLDPVAAGAVLADVVTVAERHPHSVLAQTVVRLQHNFRAGGRLLELPAKVLAGAAESALALLQHSTEPAVLQGHPADPATLHRVLEAWLAGPAAVWLAPDAWTQAHTLNQAQILCAVHAGPQGSVALNAHIARRVRRLAGVAPDQTWYAGRRVLVRRNLPALSLANGDIGLTTAAADGQLQVHFSADRCWSPDQLTDVEDAWALTVHKAQGSEYPHVLLVLPIQPELALLNREWLYTGLTRARQSLMVCADASTLHAAITRRAERGGSLRTRLGGSTGADS